MRKTLCEADTPAGEDYERYRNSERGSVCKGMVRPDGHIGRSLLATFDAPEQEARRLSAFFQTNVLDFWEWDNAENPEPFRKK